MTHRRRQNFYALPTAQWQYLAGPPINLLETFSRVDAAIDANADIADQIVKASVGSLTQADDIPNSHGQATSNDLDKAKSTIRQFYRDWSAEGTLERQASYGPVMQFLDSKFSELGTRHAINILVPGAGLSRLVYDLWQAGFTVQGNEISYHMLLASNWILNHVIAPQRFELYPFVLDFSNLLKRSHQFQSVDIPDIHAAADFAGTVDQDRMSVTASDFIRYYSEKEQKNAFDIVATVFFVDTAPNVIRYIETVKNCLKSGGYWVNNGPLLWHFADRAPPEPDKLVNPTNLPDTMGIEAPGSFELTNEELLQLIEQQGFVVEEHETTSSGQGYIKSPNSMLQNSYVCSHWVARKR